MKRISIAALAGELLAAIFFDDDSIQHDVRIGHTREIQPQRAEVKGLRNRLIFPPDASQQPPAAMTQIRARKQPEWFGGARHIAAPDCASNAAFTFG
jgi:hypothetical protein